MVYRNETGKDGVLNINSDEVPFTSFDYSVEASTTSSDFNNRLEQYTAYTNVHYSGTIEIDGANQALLEDFVIGGEGGRGGQPQRDISIMVQGTETGLRFNDVRLNSVDRTYSGGDKTDMSVSWEADRAHRVGGHGRRNSEPV